MPGADRTSRERGPAETAVAVTPTSGSGAQYWAGRELRARWRSLVALGLIAGIAAGIVVAAVAGARRTNIAYERFKEATAAPDAIVFGTQVGSVDADYGPVKELPAVIDAGEFGLAPLALKGYPGVSTLAPADKHLYRTLARPQLSAGRLPNPNRVDEILVNGPAAAKFGLGVGDRVTIVSSNSLLAFYGQHAMTGGPTIRARVVGVGNGTMDLIFGTGEPGFVPSGAVLARYGSRGIEVADGRVASSTNLVVRLRPGTDLAGFHRDVGRVLHVTDFEGEPVTGSDIPIRDLVDDDKRVLHATDVERIGLLLFAAAAALASLMLVGQAVARSVYALGEDVPTLRALGLIRRQLIAGMTLPMVTAAVVAVAATLATAVALSPAFPVGLAGRLDPDRGVHVDATVVLVGAIVAGISVLVLAVLAAWRASKAHRAARAGRSSPALRAVRRVAPLPIGIGAGLALERGRGDRSLPTRPAIIGAVAAVAGVVGSFGLIHGIDDALRTPARAGQVWDVTAFPESRADLRRVEKAVATDPEVSAAGIIDRIPMEVDGAAIPVYAVRPIRGLRPFTLVMGHAPRGRDEVALGPASARALGKRPGDHVEITIAGRRPVRMRIVGLALLPQGAHSSFDQGVLTTPTALEHITGGDATQGFANGDATLVASYAGSIPTSKRVERLHRQTGVETEGPSLPQDVVLLRDVRTFPKALAAFLVLLGIAAVGHALVTAVRRRRHDIAVLRALGFRPRQAALTIASQAGTVGAIGLILGVPIGILLGRATWRWVADATPLHYVAPIAVVVILVTVPVTILLANLLATAPARRAARLRPAEVLRAE